MPPEIEAAQGAAEDNSEFENAFAEFAGARDEPSSDQTDESSSEDSNADYETAEPESKETEPGAPKEQTEQPQKAGESNTDYEARLVAAEKAAKDFEHRFKSEVGRQAALQRKVQELQAQLESAPQGTQAERKYTERMQNLMGEFPEIAEAIREELDVRLADLRGEVQQAVAPMKQEQEQRQYQAEEARVKELYPDFTQTVQSGDFQDWFAKQPSAIQQLASSPYAGDAIAVMDYYKGSRPAVAANPAVQNILDKRQASLQRNVSVKNTAPAPVADAADDFESAFAFYARQKEKQR